MLEWFSTINKNDYVSINNKSITFPTSSKKIFDTAYKVMLGFDKDEKIIIVSVVDSDRANRGDFDQSLLNHVSVGKSYSRITNKSFIEHLIDLNLLNFSKSQNLKFKASYNEKINGYIIDLKEEIL